MVDTLVRSDQDIHANLASLSKFGRFWLLTVTAAIRGVDACALHHPAEAPCVGSDLESVRCGEYRLHRREIVGGCPVHRHHPFGVVARPRPDRHVQDNTDSRAREHLLRPDTRQHQQVCRSDCPGAQHNPVGG